MSKKSEPARTAGAVSLRVKALYLTLKMRCRDVFCSTKKMLDDPEKPKQIWTDYVWADNEGEAVQKCQLKAFKATIEVHLIKGVGRSGVRS